MPNDSRPSAVDLVSLPLHDYRPQSSLTTAETFVPRARFPAIDAHNHIGRWLSEDGDWTVPEVAKLLDVMDGAGIEAMVNLDGRRRDLTANLDRYDRAHPGRFFTFYQPDWSLLSDSSFPQSLASDMAAAIEEGARGVKVWKDLGLHLTDHEGKLLMTDDPRLGDMWAVVAEAGIPVAIHTADPVAFFQPLDEKNERLEELQHHPDWSFADDRFPRFEELMSCFENLVGSNPSVTFIGVHVGCNAEDLGWVRRMLDTYPNFNIDISARIAELGRQPYSTRKLILDHPDRVLFGTDAFPPDAEMYSIHFRFLETADEYFSYSADEPPPQGRWMIYGLDLPDDVLKRVYADNARRLILA